MPEVDVLLILVEVIPVAAGAGKLDCGRIKTNAYYFLPIQTSLLLPTEDISPYNNSGNNYEIEHKTTI